MPKLGLLGILRKNSEGDISHEERERARVLIENLGESGYCSLCCYGGRNRPALEEVGFCKDCARYLLATGK